MRAILDTSVVLVSNIAPLDGELAVSSATLAALHFGVLVAKDSAVRAERLRRLSVLQRQFDALPVDDAVAASYGQLAAARRRPGPYDDATPGRRAVGCSSSYVLLISR